MGGTEMGTRRVACRRAESPRAHSPKSRGTEPASNVEPTEKEIVVNLRHYQAITREHLRGLYLEIFFHDEEYGREFRCDVVLRDAISRGALHSYSFSAKDASVDGSRGNRGTALAHLLSQLQTRSHEIQRAASLAQSLLTPTF